MTERLKSALSTLCEQAAALVYPRYCVACRALVLPQANWCSPCWSDLALARLRTSCPTCARTLGPHLKITSKGRCPYCRDEPRILTAVCKVGDYGAVLGGAVRNFKYNKDLHAGWVLAKLLYDHLVSVPWASDLEVLVPIPSHWTAAWSKGFSPTKLLCERVSQSSLIPMMPVLRRAEFRRPQVGLSAAARSENIKGAFAIVERLPIKGATVCLIDDVMTTGATLREAARVLLDAGAKKVYGAVLARANVDE